MEASIASQQDFVLDQTPSTPSAGWYEDPHNARQHRYWDGCQWTDHVAPAPDSEIPPPRSGQPAAQASAPFFSAQAHVAEFGGATKAQVAQGAVKVWAFRLVRVPLVALALTVLGTLLPWFTVGPISFSLTDVLGWKLPVGLAVMIGAAICAYAIVPRYRGWLGMAAASLSFTVTVIAIV